MAPRGRRAPHQAELGTGFDSIIFRPASGDANAYHILEAGVYTLAISSVGGQADDQNFRLEVEAQFIPE